MLRSVFDPHRLLMARRLAGMSRAVLAGSLARSETDLIEYEFGQREPSTDERRRLAKQLDVLVEFFQTGRAQARLDTSDMHFRSSETDRQGSQVALAHLELLWEIATALETAVKLPPVDLGVPVGIAHGDPVALAAAVRKAWGRPEGPVPHIVRNLEARGVVVNWLSDSRSYVDGQLSADIAGRPFIMVAAQSIGSNRRFAACRELGHLLLHPDPSPGNERHEQAADTFAAEFLLPAAELQSGLSTGSNPTTVQRISTVYGLPINVVSNRAIELQIFDQTTQDRIMSTGDECDYPGEEPEFMTSAAHAAADHGLPIAEVAARVKLPVARVREFIGEEADAPALRLVTG